MTSLDARALTSDVEGLAFLSSVIGAAAEQPCLAERFGVSPFASPSLRRREAARPALSRRRVRPAAMAV